MDKEITNRIIEVAKEYNADFDIDIRLKKKKVDGFRIVKTGREAEIEYGRPSAAFHALSYLLCNEGDFTLAIDYDNEFGLMLDCSRNAVTDIPSLKRLMTELALLGYTYLKLYTEDMLETEGEPYYGYMRGRFSRGEIMELVAHAAQYGVEIVPCIQTLGHLSTLYKWNSYRKISDVPGTLLIGEDETYAFLERVIESVSKTFTSKRINIGLDEAVMAGLGEYLKRNGVTDRKKLFISHIDRICEICARFGMQPEMWGDLFFSLEFGTYYSDEKREFKYDYALPENLKIFYWDYYYEDEAHYENMIDQHRQLARRIAVASGLYKFQGITPDYYATERILTPAITASKNQNIRDILITAWGDDGGECSIYAMAGALVRAALLNDLQKAEGDIADARTKMLFGYTYAELKSLSSIDRYLIDKEKVVNPSKYLLYNDVLHGNFDAHVPVGMQAHFLSCAETYEKLAARDSRYSLIFVSFHRLALLLAKKCDFGTRLKSAYATGARTLLYSLLKDLDNIGVLVQDYRAAYRDEWYTFNKPFGFEIIDIRLGGLCGRIETAKYRLSQYLGGQIQSLPELEQERLFYCNVPYNDESRAVYVNSWKDIVTNGTI